MRDTAGSNGRREAEGENGWYSFTGGVLVHEQIINK